MYIRTSLASKPIASQYRMAMLNINLKSNINKNGLRDSLFNCNVFLNCNAHLKLKSLRMTKHTFPDSRHVCMHV